MAKKKINLKLLKQYERTLGDEQQSPEIHICSDGSGVVVDGCGEFLFEFDNIIELETRLAQGE